MRTAVARKNLLLLRIEMNKTSGTAIKAILVSTAVLLVAWWVWPRLSHELGVTNSATAVPPKVAASATSPAVTRAAGAALIAKTPESAVTLPANTPPTFAEALTKLSPADKEYVEAANNRLYGALDYHSIRELQWKLERGFPNIEEMLALRGKPTPPAFSSYEQIAQLKPQEIIKHFLQRTLSEQTKAGLDKSPDVDWTAQMRIITDKLDTPFPAYISASMADARTAAGQSNLVYQAMTAAAYGDSQLASEISERLKDIEYDNQHRRTLTQLTSVAGLVAIVQTEACVDRYTGNPRTVDGIREFADQRRARGNCR
jgi:DNA-binding transcriptional MerR regulator